MTDMNNINTISAPNHSPIFNGGEHGNYIIEAHTSNNMKVERPKVSAADLNQILNENKRYSVKEHTKLIEQANSDIYQGTKKEKSNHEFNLKRYFTIFGILALLTAIIGYFGKRR